MSELSNIKIKIALIGNPNAGKSSLFNALTGLNQKTGNYSGVTVDKLEGKTFYTKDGLRYEFIIVDLPGTYGFFSTSIDEKIAGNYLLNEHVDVVVVVADSTNLRRNLLLATQVLDLKMKTVIALNMIDEANSGGISIDQKGLQETLGVEVVATDSRNIHGIDQLKEAICGAKISSSYFYDIQKSGHSSYKDFIFQNILHADPARIRADQIYRFKSIDYLLQKFVHSPSRIRRAEISAKIDRITTHPVFGYTTLLFVLFLVFQCIFFVAEYPMSWIEEAFLYLQQKGHQILPQGQLSDLVSDGILPGISGVMMFIPQIALLFLFIGILEDSGYMSRASFIMDKLMRKFGLNGKSVIPLISGTACAVPSIMATRSISSHKERLITVFVLPLISCSARLPVYTLLIALLYPENEYFGIFNVKGLVLMGMYLAGFIITLITAFVLKKIVKIKESAFFIMELPVYRFPQWKNVGILLINKLKVFIVDAGKIIFAISIVLWFLSTHGTGKEFNETEHNLQIAKTANNDTAINFLEAKRLETSYIGNAGHFLEPVVKPLGFDWKISIALVTSFAAREVFVGTVAAIYGNKNTELSLTEKLRAEKDESGKPVYTAAVCWSLLLFYAFALQCMSTIAVVKRETKSWKWPLVQFVYMTGLAYVSAFIAYQLLS